jgi:hypothetical protein
LTKLTLLTPARCLAALHAMVLPPLPPLPPLSVGGEDATCSTNADSNPTALVHAICRALKARALSDRPLSTGCLGGKDSKGNGGNNNGNAGNGSRGLDQALDWDGPPLTPPSRGTTATRVAGE